MNEMFMLKATFFCEATLHCMLFCAHNLWHDRHCRRFFSLHDYCTLMPASKLLSVVTGQ